MVNGELPPLSVPATRDVAAGVSVAIIVFIIRSFGGLVVADNSTGADVTT